MTVHGAKGLEANIVFLPDAASVPRARDAQRLLIIPDQAKGAGLPLWMLSGLSVSPELQAWLDETKAKGMAERSRLLYVAMTRARDELYICGAKGKQKEVQKESWYALVESILGVKPRTEEIFRTEFEPSIVAELKPQLPAWVLNTAPVETSNDYYAVTGVASGSRDQVKSPELESYQRGTAIHRLLQNLPNIAPELRESFAKNQAKRLNLEEHEALSLVSLINWPPLAQFFGPDSEAEVEISGQLENGRFFMGRIDRMVKSQNEILILDYKSDRFVPESSGFDHPYVHQIALYSGLLQTAFPGHTVKAALLWTQGPKLEWIYPDLLTQARKQALTLREPQAS